jgi:hypothetical protein
MRFAQPRRPLEASRTHTFKFPASSNNSVADIGTSQMLPPLVPLNPLMGTGNHTCQRLQC